jgi:hypothetical protein
MQVIELNFRNGDNDVFAMLHARRVSHCTKKYTPQIARSSITV